MIVDLNDKKFNESKQGDIFVIEIIDEKKVAVPITKEKFLKCEIETLNKQQKQINELKKEVKKQSENIAKYTKAIYTFIEIMNGGNNNEETI